MPNKCLLDAQMQREAAAVPGPRDPLSTLGRLPELVLGFGPAGVHTDAQTRLHTLQAWEVLHMQPRTPRSPLASPSHDPPQPVPALLTCRVSHWSTVWINYSN